MKEQRDRPGMPNGPKNAKEQAIPHAKSELTNLFEESGLFDAHTPPGREPTVFPMDVLEHLRSNVGMKAFRMSRYNRRLADQLESWKTSINKISMAYEIPGYPFLDVAEQNFAQAPFKDPDAQAPLPSDFVLPKGLGTHKTTPTKT